MTTERPSTGLSRRHALTGAATVGIGVPLLAACSGDSGDTATDPAGGSTSSSGGGSGNGGGNGGGSASGFASTSDIEVGGGAIFADEEVVVTQPSQGDFKGFSSICTHQGCQVAEVSGGTINCTCHGSEFSIEDGSVQAGPATAPLPAVDLSVKQGQISLA